MMLPGPSAVQLGEHVRRVRGRLGFSVHEFAERAALAIATVEELEAGLREPMYPELWALAWGLGLSSPGTLFRMWERRSLDEPGELL